jgi:CDP-glucose 4,6-dehydratase
MEGRQGFLEAMGLSRQQLSDSFAACRVLVTGHTGFKGSWLALLLKMIGAEILGYALDPKNANDHYCLLAMNNEHIDVRGDIRDLPKLEQVFSEFRPQFVFHLAAQALVLESYQHPLDTIESNVLGTANLLECCRKTESVKAVVIVTSDKCYANQEWVWGYRENDRLGGHDPYSASKACAEILAESYVNSFFSRDSRIGTATARAGNVIGGGDWAQNRIVPDCIRGLAATRDIVVRNPLAIRPWQHVLDPLYGYLCLAARLAEQPNVYQGSWNFGPEAGSMKHVQELVERIISSWGSGAWKLDADAEAPHEATSLFLDVTKARYRLNLKPVWDFDQAITNTVDWYKEYYLGNDIRAFSEKQINNFLDCVDNEN